MRVEPNSMPRTVFPLSIAYWLPDFVLSIFDIVTHRLQRLSFENWRSLNGLVINLYVCSQPTFHIGQEGFDYIPIWCRIRFQSTFNSFQLFTREGRYFSIGHVHLSIKSSKTDLTYWQPCSFFLWGYLSMTRLARFHSCFYSTLTMTYNISLSRYLEW